MAARPNTSATGDPAISGTPQVGKTLTAGTSGIDDADGLTSVSYRYQWIRSDGDTDADIAGETDSTYTLSDDDEGRTIKVRVSFTDDAGNGESLTSAPTAAVAAANKPATGAPTVSGRAQVGETLMADVSGIADADGLDNAVFSYQWTAGGSDIDGANGSTHTLDDNDEGRTIRVAASFTDDAGNPEALTSAATGAVQPPANSPKITGTARVGETLTVDTSPISDADGLEDAVFSYQWIAGGVDIEGAAGASYTIIAEDEGLIIKVWVSFTDDAGNPETRTSDGTEAVAPGTPPNNPATGAPTITGTVQVGETLTVDTSAIQDSDGLDDAVFTYQWTAGGVDIEGATGTSYTLTGDDEGLTVQVWVFFTDDAGNPEVFTSAAAGEVAARPNSPATGQPTIRGIAHAGQTLTAGTAGIADADGLDDAIFSYQWRANDGTTDMDIEDAEDSTYSVSDDDVGKVINVRVSFTDDAGAEETLTSAATGVVAAKPNAPATGAPTIDGTAQVGETLTALTNGITDEDGLTNVSYSHQWIRNDGTNDAGIGGQTGSTYTLTDEDAGKTIKVRVSFTDAAGNAETRTSEATDTVAATKPGVPGHLNVFPHDTGALDVYWEAPASDGGSAITGYKVRWKESADSWETSADVSETTVTGTTHTITGLTDGVEYSVRVRATNGVGDSPPSAEKPGTPRETQAPQMVRPSVDGATLRVLYDEALDEGSAPPADSFDVRVACTCDDTTWRDEEAKRAVESVSVDGSTVVLTLVSAATSEDVVVVSYTPPSDAAAARIRDLAGNAADGFNSTEVFNDTDEVAESEGDGEAEGDGETDTPLTVSLENSPGSHNGTDVFTFEIRFSEEFGLSYKTLRDYAFTVVGGEVKKAQRMDRDSNTPNIWWLITVEPGGNGDATIALPATTDCTGDGAICTGDGRKLSNSLNFTVSGPGQ